MIIVPDLDIHLPENSSMTLAKMKGSLLRKANKQKNIEPMLSLDLNHNLYSFNVSKQKKCRAPETDSQELVHSRKFGKAQEKGPKIKFSLNLGELMSKKYSSRPQTSNAAAKNYCPSAPKSDRSMLKDTDSHHENISQNINIFKEVDSLKDNRLSLSNFHDKVKIRSKIMIKAKTEEQLINIKLQGQCCNLAVSNMRKEKIKKNKSCLRRIYKADIFKRPLNVYLTQNCENNSGKNKQPNPQKCVDFKKIVSGMNVQTQGLSQIDRMRSSIMNNSFKKRSQRKSVSTTRGKVEVNIINISGGDSVTKIKNRSPFYQFYTQNIKCPDEDTRIFEEQAGRIKIPKQALILELRQIEKEIQTINRIKSDRLVTQTDKSKYTTQQLDQKLNKRKQLMKDYTFKKPNYASKVEAKKPACTDDFYVNGWENSQEFSRKEIINVQ